MPPTTRARNPLASAAAADIDTESADTCFHYYFAEELDTLGALGDGVLVMVLVLVLVLVMTLAISASSLGDSCQNRAATAAAFRLICSSSSQREVQSFVQ